MVRTLLPFIVFILRSAVIGTIVAALVLMFVPQLRTGSGLQSLLSPNSNTDPRKGITSYYDALSQAAPAVVNIYSISVETSTSIFQRRPTERTNLGSGVMMNDSGYLLTCYHVVGNADSIYVALQDSRVFEAQIVGYDTLTDLAVLKVNADNIQAIPQMEVPDTRVGDTVMAIGNPFDLGQTITHGIVSRAGRSGLSNYVDFIQTDAVLNQGNSGGALIDSNGYLVGITNANFQVQDAQRRVRNVDGINFAVPYQLAKRVMDEIINNGKVVRGQLGFSGVEYRGRPGIEVTSVAPNSPAYRAGLRAEDIILAIDGVRLESASKTLDMIAETDPGTELALEVSREGKLLNIEAMVAELDISSI